MRRILFSFAFLGLAAICCAQSAPTATVTIANVTIIDTTGGPPQLHRTVTVRKGVIEDIRFHGRGCAISQASASLLTERLKGLSLDEAKKINKEDVLGELGIDISPARIKCALLSLKVLKVGAYGLADTDEE